jgi:hypothetical protein
VARQRQERFGSSLRQCGRILERCQPFGSTKSAVRGNRGGRGSRRGCRLVGRAGDVGSMGERRRTAWRAGPLGPAPFQARLAGGMRLRAPLLTAATWGVLVQREMECGRSPLASIARASAGKRKQLTETATGFKRRLGWATVGTPGAPDTEILALRQGLDGRGPYSKRRPTG